MAVLSEPVLVKNASSPRAVLLLESQICGHCALASGESAKQPSTNRMRTNASKGERFINFLMGELSFSYMQSFENLANFARRIGARLPQHVRKLHPVMKTGDFLNPTEANAPAYR